MEWFKYPEDNESESENNPVVVVSPFTRIEYEKHTINTKNNVFTFIL